MIPTKAIDYKAIVIAIAGTMSLDLLLSVVLTSAFTGPGSPADLSGQQIDALLSNTRFLIWSLILGTASTVIGGFLAARFATKVPYYHALIYGIFALIFGVLTSGGLPLWYNAAGFVIVLPAALLGGYIAKRGMPRF